MRGDGEIWGPDAGFPKQGGKVTTRVGVTLLAVVILPACPWPARGQPVSSDERGSPVQLDFQLGLSEYSTGYEECDDSTALTPGIGLRTRGPLIFHASLDVFEALRRCEFASRPAVSGGDDVLLVGSTRFNLSFGAWVGYAFRVQRMWLEPTVGAGFVGTKTNYGFVSPFEESRQPWVAGKLIARRGRSGIGARLQIGVHRVPRRYHTLGAGGPGTGQPLVPGESVRRFHEWTSFTELGVSMPLIGGAPRSAAAEASELPLELSLHVAMGKHSNGERDCGRPSAISVGLEAQTRGPLLLGGTVGVIESLYQRGCAIQVTAAPPGPPTGGTEAWGKTTFTYAPRLGATVGYRVDAEGVWGEPALAGGVVRSHTDYDHGISDENTWQPWWAGGISLGGRGSGIGVQLEIGRHRIPRRYYALSPVAFVSEAGRWNSFWQIGLSAPLN